MAVQAGNAIEFVEMSPGDPLRLSDSFPRSDRRSLKVFSAVKLILGISSLSSKGLRVPDIADCAQLTSLV
jgi:hypothetical protein